jgi:hypothetical protein
MPARTSGIKITGGGLGPLAPMKSPPPPSMFTLRVFGTTVVSWGKSEQPSASALYATTKYNMKLKNEAMSMLTYLANEFKCLDRLISTTDTSFNDQFDVCSNFSSQ